MADSNVNITQGSGVSIDTRTESTNSHHRQVVVLGDPAINANVAAVLTQDGLTSDETTPAIAVRSVGSLAVTIAGSPTTMGVYLHSTAGSIAVNVGKVDGTIFVAFSPGTPAVRIADDGGVVADVDTTGIDGESNNTNRLDVSSHMQHFNGTTWDRTRGGSGVAAMALRVVHATDVASSVSIVGVNTSNTLGVHIVGTGGTIGVNVGTIAGTTAVYLHSTAGTLWVKPDPAGTYFTNGAHTSSIFTVSGSTSGGTTSGVTLVAPSSAYNFKVYAYSLQTTGAVSQAIRFTNGGDSETELWRPLVTASGVTGAQGANLAVQPPGFIFATGTNVTLAIKNDSGSLIHYSVSYIKESA